MGLPLLAATIARARDEDDASTGRRWGMVIDLGKCSADCDACVRACRKENNVAAHGNEDWDVHWIRKVTVRKGNTPSAGPEKSVPILCNHCDDPPCAQGLPRSGHVQAPRWHSHRRSSPLHRMPILHDRVPVQCQAFSTTKRAMTGPTRIAPGVHTESPESCNLCAHRLDRGGRPACVEACENIGANAICVGDLNDPESAVTKLIASNPVKGLREDLGTKPKVFYMGPPRPVSVEEWDGNKNSNELRVAPPGTYLLLSLLALMAFAGLYSTYVMYTEGIYLSGMTNRIPWGLQIILAVFYIGLSAGSLVISSLYGIFGKIEYKPLRANRGLPGFPLPGGGPDVDSL